MFINTNTIAKATGTSATTLALERTRLLDLTGYSHREAYV